MRGDSLVALFDVGKTNTKLALIDSRTHEEVWSARRASQSVNAEYGRELDVLEIERWLLDALRQAPHKERIDTIVPVAHGAAAVLIDAAGEILAAPDYEDTCYERVSEDYDRARDAFTETFSPNLPCGLNLARQLYYLQRTRAGLFDRAAHLLLYPQYWAWRLSGTLASELTSLGCHTDLWRPREARFSNLARTCGWAERFPRVRSAREKLGGLRESVVAHTGLDGRCEVACGIHDSNASYLRFLIGREHSPFIVVSSGTWTIVMANGGDLTRLEEQRDMLANVNAFGSPVPTARFMGGREYEAIARGQGVPTLESVREIVRTGVMALPSFASAGPFNGRIGQLVNAAGLNGMARASLATLYSALMTDLSIESHGARGEVFVDGPLAANPLFAPLLAALTDVGQVKRAPSTTAAGRVAAYLAGFAGDSQEPLMDVEPFDIPELLSYRDRWREALR